MNIALAARRARGLVQLATDATVGVADIAEGVHQSVLQAIGIGGRAAGRTTGLTGAIYRSVRAVARGVGAVGERALIAVESTTASDAPVDDGGESDLLAMLAVLNGVIGDHLAATDSPLAIPMSLRIGDDAREVRASGRILLLVHGLCMHDRHWTCSEDDAADFGCLLATTLGYTPVYVRYNSGRHISQNGRELSAQLDALLQHWPVPVEQVSVLAHSMGGLVACSAAHHARVVDAAWLRHLRHLVFLGTPHHGAPLERAGNVFETLLAGSRFTAPFARLGALRSSGITDLRHGNLIDADWQDTDRFRRQPDQRRHVPLPDGVACHAVAATLASRRSALADRLVGDGLVPLRSALGQHELDARRLQFDSEWIACRTGHVGLLRSNEVGRRLVDWLR